MAEMNLPAADQLHNCNVLIEQGKADASRGFLLIASALSLVLKEKLWVDSYQNFGEYCTSVNLSRSYAYKLCQIWDKWGEKAKGIDVHRLTKLLPLEVDEEVLEQARELNPGAFNDKLRELKKLKPSDAECKHDGEIHSYCSICRKRVA